MSSTKQTRGELAAKIAAGGSRYESASKLEVKAYVDQEVERFATAVAGDFQTLDKGVRETIDEEIRALRGIVDSNERRIAELELTWWKRVWRWLRNNGEDLVAAVASIDDPDNPPSRHDPDYLVGTISEPFTGGEAPAVQWTGDPVCLEGTALEEFYHKGAVQRVDRSIDVENADGETTGQCRVGDWLVLTAAGLRVISGEKVVEHPDGVQHG